MVRGSYAFDGKNLESVVVEDRDGWAFWQGDIILGRTEDIVAGVVPRGNAEDGRQHPLGVQVPSRLWPAGVVAYDMTRLASGQRPMVDMAMKHIAANSPVRFSRDIDKYAKYTDGPNEGKYDLVQFQNTSNPDLGGSSAVGRTGSGPQILLLNDSLSGTSGAATAAHELVHALGAWHEQSRADRDSFVTVFLSNVKPDYAFNFDIHSSDGIMTGSYDYCSAMHYSRYAFASGSGATIVPKSPVSCTANKVDGSGTVTVTDIGQRYGLSTGDFAMLKSRYSSAPANRPVANAGTNITLSGIGRRTAQLNGSASYAVPGATIVKYQWEPAECLNYDECYNPIINSTSANASVELELWGSDPNFTQKYRLTVTDNLGRTMSDVVTVTRTH